MRFNSPVRFPIILGSGFLLASALLVACGKTTNSSATRSTTPAPTYVNPNTYQPNYNNGASSPISGNVSQINNGNIQPVVRPNQPGWAGSVTTSDELATFDPQEELREGDLGHWVTVGSQRFFQPILGPEDTNWQPVQHGYWSFEAVRGFTWVSYDRFGEVTDHFGYWRHHEKFGWIWGYTPELRYRASVVTWFDHGSNIGWYPATFDQPNLYTLDNRVGFDDGYWRGASLLVQIGTPGFAFNVGFNVVDRRYVTSTDVAAHCLDIRRNRDEIFTIAHQAQLENRFSLYPGVDRKNAYEFITLHAAKPPLMSDVAVREVGNGRRMIGVQVNQAPAHLPKIEQSRAAAIKSPELSPRVSTQQQPAPRIESAPKQVASAPVIPQAPAKVVAPPVEKQSSAPSVAPDKKHSTAPQVTAPQVPATQQKAPATSPAPVQKQTVAPTAPVEKKADATSPTAAPADTGVTRRGPRAAAPHISVDRTTAPADTTGSLDTTRGQARTADAGTLAPAGRQGRRGNVQQN